MKIVLATCGSRGDVQPMLALTLALKAAGHEALLAGPPEKADWAARLGCDYRPMGGDVTALIDRQDSAVSVRTALTFVGFVRREIVGQFRELPGIVAGADRVVGASLCFGLASVAEAGNIPYRFVAFAPQMLPSRHHPFMAFKNQRLPGWCNRTGWRCIQIADRLNLTRLLNGQRRRLGLKPIRDCWRHVMGPEVIVASDPAVALLPPDARAGAVQTGYMHLPLPPRELPELEAFLAAGPAPVYAGFGSMPPRDQAALVPLIRAAARRAGRRVVIARFWEEASGSDAGGDVFFIRRYPHGQLFPHMAAVVHHGGAGTTATAAASGVPQVIVPHILDQYYWGERVYRAGLGPQPIWRRRLTAGRLAGAIRACLEQRRIRRAARSTGRQIRSQEGTQQAVRAIVG